MIKASDFLSIKVKNYKFHIKDNDLSIPVTVIWQNEYCDDITIHIHDNGKIFTTNAKEDIKFGDLIFKHDYKFTLKANEKSEKDAVIELSETVNNYLKTVDNPELKLVLPFSIEANFAYIRVNKFL